MKLPDRVKESSTTVGTGPFGLGGAPVGFRTFAAGLSLGDAVPYCAVLGAEFEIGVGTLTAAATLARTTVTASSNSGNPVNFAAGTKEVFATVPSHVLTKFNSSDSIAFATAVPLTMRGAAYMPQQAVASVLAFTIAPNPVQGALAYVRLVANGTHVPTFAGMKEWGGSLGYDNRNGIANQVQFFYDGVDYWFSISQAVGAVAVDGTAPTALSALIANATPAIVTITHSEALDPAHVPIPAAYTVAGHIASAVAVSGSAVNVTFGTPFVNGEVARTIAYAKTGTNDVRDIAGNLLENFSGMSIANNVGAVASGATLAGPSGGSVSVASTNITLAIAPVGSNITGTVRYTFADGGAGGSFNPAFLDLNNATPSGTTQYTPSATAGARTLTTTNNGGLTNPTLAYTSTASSTFIRARAGFTSMVESGTGPYAYAGNGGGISGTPGCVFDKGLQSEVDGSLSMILQSNPVGGANVPFFGIMAGVAPVEYAGFILSIFIGSSATYQPFTSGVNQIPANTVTAAIGDLIRLRRTGSALVAEVSKNSGSTWTTIYSLTGQSTAALNFDLMLYGTGSINGLAGVGLA